MATRKIREIEIYESNGNFSILKSSQSKSEYNFSGISALRQLFSNEKAKILHIIKTQNPSSIYDLAKKLGRSFKSVSKDIKVLERFGLVELVQEKTKNRIRHKPSITVDSITVHFKIK
jgi:predicted transcriptional regulator